MHARRHVIIDVRARAITLLTKTALECGALPMDKNTSLFPPPQPRTKSRTHSRPSDVAPPLRLHRSFRMTFFIMVTASPGEMRKTYRP